MLLTLKVGNTTIAAGVFRGTELRAQWHAATRYDATPDELGMSVVQFLRAHDIEVDALDGVMISSVVPPLNWALSQACQSYLKLDPAFLTADWDLMPLEVREPERVGSDRLADCLAAHEQYGGPLLVIDFGTATTFNLISAEGAFLGGAIGPTMELASETLTRRTAQLFKIELVPPPSVVGKDTAEHLQSGIVLGFLDMVQGLIQRFRAEHPEPLQVIATGGWGRFFAAQLEEIAIYNPHLALDGLRIAWQRYVEASP
jgi:type III pantothenate kinase